MDMREQASIIKNPVICKNVQSAFRDIMLHTIGNFNKNHNKREIEVTVNEWPIVMEGLQSEDLASATRIGDLIIANEHVPLTEKQSQYYYSAIPMYIWSYCRMMIAKTMLSIDYNIIIGCHTDAIYTTQNPNLPDDGRVGMFRLKGYFHKICNMPRNNTEMSLIKDLSEQNMKGCN